MKSLDSGGATGPLDELDASSIELTALRNAIYMAEEIGHFTTTTRDLLESARVVSNIRNLALQKQWDSVYKITSDVLSKGRQAFSDAAFQEADFLHSAIEEQRVIAGYMNALASGAATYNIEKEIAVEEETISEGNRRLSLLSSDKFDAKYFKRNGIIPHLDISTIDIDELAEALKVGDAYGCRTAKSIELRERSILTLRLREALLAGQMYYWSHFRRGRGEKRELT